MKGFEKLSDGCCHNTVLKRCEDCGVDKPIETVYTISGLNLDEFKQALWRAVPEGGDWGQMQKVLDKLKKL